MFTVYKKITTPESSPVLGPATSPVITAITESTNSETNTVFEPFSLYNCCCTSRVNDKSKKDPSIQETAQCETSEIKSKYEFGHATHYIYNVSTPRLICEFETGTPMDP